jgi:energy-converting hydrogenase B subunit Q
VPPCDSRGMQDDRARPFRVDDDAELMASDPDLPDLLIPEPGRIAAKLSVRTTADCDVLAILGALRGVDADVTSFTVFPATKGEPGVARVVDVEFRDVEGSVAADVVQGVPGVVVAEARQTLGQVFGKRVIVIGGGAQVAQVALGAVSEADRHNLRGERISVDTIALVGEERIANAVRAVADLPRAHILVLAGSIMGGDITRAVQELQETGIPVVALNMVGSVPDVVDLVVSDPVQAGTMAVMAISDTARFDIARQRGKRY